MSDGTPTSVLDAVRSAITRHPALHTAEQQVEVTRAQRRQASSIFDRVEGAGFNQVRSNYPLTRAQQASAFAGGISTSDLATNLTDMNAGVSRLLRDGISFGVTGDMGRTTDNLSTISGVNLARVGLQVTIPLLRGRGREVVTAQENAAGIEVDATMLDLRHALASLTRNAVVNYWLYVAAQKSLAVAIGSEQRGRAFLDNVRTLIEADQSPRSDIRNVAANLADREAARIVAAENEMEARQALALSMGLDKENVVSPLTPSNKLPQPESGFLPPNDVLSVSRYIDYSMEHRADLLAAGRRVAEAKLLSQASTDLLKPQFNLNFSTGYTGLGEGTDPFRYLRSPFGSIQGLDATGGITYTFPRASNFAKGKVAQTTAQLRQAQIQVEDLSRNIASSIEVFNSALRNTILRLEKAHHSVNEFQGALRGEQDKLALGIGSIIDILTVEDRLTNALQGEVQAQLAYAVALVNFRFATGTLISGHEPAVSIQETDLVTFPALN